MYSEEHLDIVVADERKVKMKVKVGFQLPWQKG